MTTLNRVGLLIIFIFGILFFNGCSLFTYDERSPIINNNSFTNFVPPNVTTNMAKPSHTNSVP